MSLNESLAQIENSNNLSKKPEACYSHMVDISSFQHPQHLLESFDHIQVDRSCMIYTTNAIPKPHNINSPIHCGCAPIVGAKKENLLLKAEDIRLETWSKLRRRYIVFRENALPSFGY
ncbi:hypothetical protein BGAL_0286g00100 [Botrytis galanthina]|uniref:Uncharacterized protein n=1 Tax=Botrytis galanthina TaxID=278940 RepID=A0A4V4HU30_9HELO|nr:hypothetical protein BGAL_0286g00100 [Botrytis galanthina]